MTVLIEEGENQLRCFERGTLISRWADGNAASPCCAQVEARGSLRKEGPPSTSMEVSFLAYRLIYKMWELKGDPSVVGHDAILPQA